MWNHASNAFVLANEGFKVLLTVPYTKVDIPFVVTLTAFIKRKLI